jgi:hypothetical protein
LPKKLTCLNRAHATAKRKCKFGQSTVTCC